MWAWTLNLLSCNVCAPLRLKPYLLLPHPESLQLSMYGVMAHSQFAALSGVTVLSYANHWDAGQTIAAVLSIVFMFTLDQVSVVQLYSGQMPSGS